ncbi:hypothetical protein JI57_03085 [Psychromonas sp. PRT-SC03]|nr:hypothetical protein JI57_03125 [Psychromonas sp. PRT-SC03]KPU82965.1 hypothetical protein JI57_03085 [Psychromonas sp. PRT-SC03]
MASSEEIMHWQSIFKSQKDSGLTVSTFCNQHQLVPLFVSESINAPCIFVDDQNTKWLSIVVQ